MSVARNTFYLYIRMVVTMLIGVWTSRLVLNALGFTDQGLYNVVGGFVGFLSLISGSVGAAISRYLTFELGRNDLEALKAAYRNAVSIQLILALIVLVLAESVGLWYVNNVLVVTPGRLPAVNFVYQFSVASFIVSLLSVAPNALVIANERMGAFAAVSVATALCNLTIGFVITYASTDRLILYAGLQFCVYLGVRIFYHLYCRRHFPYCSNRPALQAGVFRPMFAFAGWNMIGSSASILRTSGTSVLLNYFGGPIANTINGIANQINILATMFVNDFTTAFTPQITKKYAAKQYPELIVFVHRCAKFSYCLLLIVALPVFLNVGSILVIWLKKVPEGTDLFARLIIIFTALECVSKPLITAKSATGNIRNYQIIVGGLLLLTIPLSWLFLHLGFPLWFSYLSFIITSAAAFIARMILLQGSIPHWSTMAFLGGPMVRCLLATLVAALVPVAMWLWLPKSNLHAVLQCLVGFIWCSLAVYSVACNHDEKAYLRTILSRIRRKV